MLRVTLRSLGARKLRTFAMLLSVLLGVTMIAGTYVFTDTIDRAFGLLILLVTKQVPALHGDAASRDAMFRRITQEVLCCLFVASAQDHRRIRRG